MKMTTHPVVTMPESYVGRVELVAETKDDARLMGILSRLVQCGTTPHEGLVVLLEIVTEKAKQSRSGGRDQ